MKAPAFWQHDGLLPRVLQPAAWAVARLTARRVARPGWTASVPVLCVGNAGVGGAGKTTVVLDVVGRLKARGRRVHCLTRGYGGRAPVESVLRVDVDARADWVGDEALLLAAAAPTWRCADRALAARAAIAAGADVLVMDDGLQNPTLRPTASLLVVDATVGFGNGRVMPAGPLREPAMAAAARCRAAILIGDGPVPSLALPFLRAHLAADTLLSAVRVFAFAGIARPSKFHATLRDAGAVLVGHADFPDHHPFLASELQDVFDRAAVLFATPVTTPKDAVRLDPVEREQVQVVGVRLVWDDSGAIEVVLDETFEEFRLRMLGLSGNNRK